ncbi:MAG: serine/threonine protein kinase [Labilithrix sp.]|nr:serine/threonine protein kinase [Labilithrix sp.]
MASVHLARLMGAVGFSRTVAIKRLHRHLANDEAFHAMFLDEARLAARIRHPNVVPTLDVVTVEQELFLVMDYVHGESLNKLQRVAKAANESIPLGIASAVLVSTLHGLHAAHEATTETGERLGIVHRDVSPHNILVGSDGVVRVLDFGIAKAMGRLHTTRDGEVKGKAAYMAPEQLRALAVDARTDVYAASVVLWELLTGQRLFAGDSPEAIMNMVLERDASPPSKLNAEVPSALDALVLRGLSRDACKRFPTAREMAIELESIIPPATPHAVGEWVERTSGEVLRRRARMVADIESQRSLGDTDAAAAPPSSAPPVERVSSAPTATMVAPLPSSPSRSSALTYVAFGVAAVAVGVASWSFVTFRRTPPPTVASSSVVDPVIGSSSPSPSSSSSSPSSSALVSVIETPSPAPPSAKAAATLPDGHRSPSGTRPVTASPVRRAPARAASPATRKCDPPYVIDANGDRSPKPECL